MDKSGKNEGTADQDVLEQEKLKEALRAKWSITYGRLPTSDELAKMDELVEVLSEEKRRAGPDPFREFFYQLRGLACVRLGISPEEHPDPFRLGCELAAAAKTREELEAAKMLACRAFPNGPNFDEFMRSRYVPKVEELYAGKRLRACRDCFSLFLQTDRRDMYCSPQCKDRHSKRGKPRAGSGRAAPDELRAHFERGCAECHAGQPCPTRERLLARDEMYSRRRRYGTPEVHEEKAAERGRSKKHTA